MERKQAEAPDQVGAAGSAATAAEARPLSDAVEAWPLLAEGLA